MRKELRVLLLGITFHITSCTSATDKELDRVNEIIEDRNYDQLGVAFETLNELLVKDPFNVEFISLLEKAIATRNKEYQRVCRLYSQYNKQVTPSETIFPWIRPVDPWNEWIWWYPGKEIDHLKLKLKEGSIDEKSFELKKEELVQKAKDEFVSKGSKYPYRYVDWSVFNQYRNDLTLQSETN